MDATELAAAERAVSELPSFALLPFDLAARRSLVASGAPFAELANSLAHDLEPWLDIPMPISLDKARLTRAGGRCPTHGTFLDFDPAQPHDHWCVQCSREYRGRVHDQWWAMGAHLWTAERAVHSAALYALRDDTRHAHFAARILREYTTRYASWPNDDNVLGPSRVFFSTYLESLWLLNLCHAAALLGPHNAAWTETDRASFAARVLEPASTLIASYNEGASNRQVWNEAAIMSAWTLLGRTTEVRQRAQETHGLLWQLQHGLDEDGFWYEGENYHLFAHRGLWYSIQLLGALGIDLPRPLSERFARGFAAPFAGVLPDETFPSRRDSQYGTSVRQWRIAEWCELGWTYTHNAFIAGVLSRLYAADIPRRETRRDRSTGDAERGVPASSLTRADLSWRALLMAEPTILAARPAPPVSKVLPSQGVAVIRRDAGKWYVALDGGETGGGHGHPDQLALTIQHDVDRWLEDPGTGTYVELELHWYRSTMAHAAPLFDGVSQRPVPATLTAFEDRGAYGWIEKHVVGLIADVALTRTIIVAQQYVLDVLEWQGAGDHALLLPIAGAAEVCNEAGETISNCSWKAAPLPRAWQSNADAWAHAHDFAIAEIPTSGQAAVTPTTDGIWLNVRPTQAQPAPAQPKPAQPSVITDHAAGPKALLHYRSTHPVQLLRANVPGAPGHPRVSRHFLQTQADRGRVVGVWMFDERAAPPRDAARTVQLNPEGDVLARITSADGTTALHSRAPHGWHIELLAGNARSSIDLETLASPTVVAARERVARVATPSAVIALQSGKATLVELREAHYVQTESPWHEAGRPEAELRLSHNDQELTLEIIAHTGPVKSHAPSTDELDNEIPEINLSGVQWYFAPADVGVTDESPWPVSGIAAVSETSAGEPCVVQRTLSGALTPTVDLHLSENFWQLRMRFPVAALPLNALGAVNFECVVNECPPRRERRRGQLVLSGGGGFGYLAGPRRSPLQCVQLHFRFAPGTTTPR